MRRKTIKRRGGTKTDAELKELTFDELLELSPAEYKRYEELHPSSGKENAEINAVVEELFKEAPKKKMGPKVAALAAKFGQKGGRKRRKTRRIR